MKDQTANSFITQLLNKNPELRLGGSYNALKRHPFLSSIDWVIFHYNLERLTRKENQACILNPQEQANRSLKVDEQGKKSEHPASSCQWKSPNP